MVFGARIFLKSGDHWECLTQVSFFSLLFCQRKAKQPSANAGSKFSLFPSAAPTWTFATMLSGSRWTSECAARRRIGRGPKRSLGRNTSNAWRELPCAYRKALSTTPLLICNVFVSDCTQAREATLRREVAPAELRNVWQEDQKWESLLLKLRTAYEDAFLHRWKNVLHKKALSHYSLHWVNNPSILLLTSSYMCMSSVYCPQHTLVLPKLTCFCEAQHRIRIRRW